MPDTAAFPNGSPRGETWTAERLDLLRKMWAEGETAAAIAARLGLSRSAVLGKVFRLRLGTNTGRAPEKKNGAERGVSEGLRKRLAEPVSTESSFSLDRRRARSKSPEAPPPSPVRATQHKTLLELTNETCRWPHGRPGAKNFFFCGAVGADLGHGIPYCPHHMQRAYPAPALDLVAAQ